MHSNEFETIIITLFFRLELDKLRSLVRYIMQFITLRQFSPNDKSLPPLAKTLWWIPSATKTLALIRKFMLFVF